MTKEKTLSLTKYMNDLINRLNDAIPEKHVGHPETYKQFLRREIENVKIKLDDAKLEGSGK